MLKIMLNRIFIPVLALGMGWYLAIKWPYTLFVIIVGFAIMILVACKDFLNED